MNKRLLWFLPAVCFGLWCLAPRPSRGFAADQAPEAPREVMFDVVKIDGPVHDPAKYTYWFGPYPECTSVLDINGDGRNDVVTTTGWFEAPARPTEDPWIWHPDWSFESEPGDSGVGLPILVTDVNGDGLNDVIMGSAHAYGLVWYEQRLQNGKRSFVQHWIETDYSVFHTMVLVDLDGDGRQELVTGKQLFAHNGGDPGSLEPVFLFYYKFSKGVFLSATSCPTALSSRISGKATRSRRRTM